MDDGRQQRWMMGDSRDGWWEKQGDVHYLSLLSLLLLLLLLLEVMMVLEVKAWKECRLA